MDTALNFGVFSTKKSKRLQIKWRKKKFSKKKVKIYEKRLDRACLSCYNF
jgi:hypothetical protein